MDSVIVVKMYLDIVLMYKKFDIYLLTSNKQSKPHFVVQFKEVKFNFLKSYSGLQFFEEKNNVST